MKDQEKAKKPGWMRKKLLIDEHFQLRFIAFAGGSALVASVAFYGAASYFFAKYTTYAIEVGLRPSHPFYTVLYNMENMLAYIFAFVSVGVIIFSVTAGMYFSNKVAGPMYRLKQHFDRVARGETVDDVKFREHDYFTEVADSYNKQMAQIRAKLPADAFPSGEPKPFPFKKSA